MRQWRTTIAAAVVLVTTALPIFAPEYQEKCDKFFHVAVAMGFIHAADAASKRRKQKIKNPFK